MMVKGTTAAISSQAIEGVWRLVRTLGWNQAGESMPAPYGAHPMGQLCLLQGRMLAALCNAEMDLESASREYNSYGGAYVFDGTTLSTRVDVSSRTDWIGSLQVREARLDGDYLILRPPLRDYHGVTMQRELHWERIWRP